MIGADEIFARQATSAQATGPQAGILASAGKNRENNRENNREDFRNKGK